MFDHEEGWNSGVVEVEEVGLVIRVRGVVTCVCIRLVEGPLPRLQRAGLQNQLALIVEPPGPLPIL